MDTNIAAISGWLFTLATAAFAWLKTKDVRELLKVVGFLDPNNATITDAPQSKYLPDGTWKLGDNQYREILDGLDKTERLAVISFVQSMEAARYERYEIETSKGTYVIENGYIEARPPAPVPQPKIIWSDGYRIGHFAISHLEQSSGVPAETIDPEKNQITVVGRPDNAGAIIIGLTVGDEDIQVKSMEALTSDALNKDWPISFRLWQYNKTIAGDTVKILVKQGYRRRDPDTDVTSVVWTEHRVFELPVKR